MDINELETNFGVRQLLTNIVINFSQNFLWLIINYQVIYDWFEICFICSYGCNLLQNEFESQTFIFRATYYVFEPANITQPLGGLSLAMAIVILQILWFLCRAYKRHALTNQQVMPVTALINGALLIPNGSIYYALQSPREQDVYLKQNVL